MLGIVEQARQRGGVILMGGPCRIVPDHWEGFCMTATLIEDVDPQAEISRCELFGPIAVLYRANNLVASLRQAYDSPYGLPACIHTCSLDHAVRFCDKVQAGAAVPNAGTYGSEPGTEALDLYSELKDVYANTDLNQW
jgi:aldehyde dehydrogenase (NAD+)